MSARICSLFLHFARPFTALTYLIVQGNFPSCGDGRLVLPRCDRDLTRHRRLQAFGRLQCHSLVVRDVPLSASFQFRLIIFNPNDEWRARSATACLDLQSARGLARIYTREKGLIFILFWTILSEMDHIGRYSSNRPGANNYRTDQPNICLRAAPLSAAPTPGLLWVTIKAPWSVCGGKSGVRSNRMTYPAT